MAVSEAQPCPRLFVTVRMSLPWVPIQKWPVPSLQVDLKFKPFIEHVDLTENISVHSCLNNPLKDPIINPIQPLSQGYETYH